MNKLPLISIITPTYNRKELLEKAILSVINQKKDIPFEWELLIVDDGSVDGTKEYIQKYLDKYKSNIKYFYQKNSGVGKARNIGIDNMSKNSDYTIFLDSDDELKDNLIVFFLDKCEKLIKNNEYDNVLGFYFLCEDELGNVIGNKKILSSKKEISFGYKNYLNGEINVEMGIMLKSNIFLNFPKLRFPEDVVTETVMRSKMWQFMDNNGLKILLYDYIGRLYNINHNGELKITKTISKERFKKNAIGNEQVLEIIGNDLLKYGYNNNYGEILFRAGINRILFGEKNKGLFFLKKSLRYDKKIRNKLIYFLSIFSRSIILLIYKLYI